MKTVHKILAIILLMALLVSVIAVASTAAVTGNDQTYTADFENYDDLPEGSTSDVILDGSANSAATVAIGNWNLNNAANSGKYYIKQNKYDGNKYFQFDFYNADRQTAGVWIGKYLTGKNAPLSNYNYSVLDLDFWAPSGLIKHGMNFQFCIREVDDKYNSNGSSNQFSTALFSTVKTPHIANNGSENYFWFGGSDTNRVDFDHTIWNHLTVVLDTSSGTSCDLYVFLNGEYGFKAENMLSSADLAAFYLETIRINFPNETSDNGCTIALDNIEFNSYSKSYTDTTLSDVIASEGSLNDWTNSIYNDSYVMPMSVPRAEVNGVQYDSLERAISKANEGDTVKLLSDITAPVTVSKDILIDTNGYAISSITAAEGLSCFRVGNYYKVSSDKVIDHGYLDFESVEGSEHTGTSNPNYGNNYNFDYKSGTNGTITYPTEGGDKYFRFDSPAVTTVEDTFHQKSISSNKHTHSEVAYYTLDLDVWLPTGAPLNETNLFYFTNRLSNGSFNSTVGNPSAMWYTDATGKVWLGAKTDACVVDTDKWNHITAVVKIYLDSATSTYTLEHHLFINGEYAGLINTKTGSNATDYIQEVRIQANQSTSTAVAYAYDNFSVKTYLNGYDSTELESALSTGDLSVWSDNGYDETSVHTADTVATVNGVEYDSFIEAVEAAKAGDVVVLLKNTPSSVTVSKRIKIDTQGFTTGTVAAGSGYQVIQSGNVYSIVTDAMTDYGVTDFSSEVTYDADGNHKYDDKANFIVKENSNAPEIKTSAYDSNKYFTFAYTQGLSETPYLNKQSVSLPNKNSIDNIPNRLDAVDYHVLDLDVWTPDGKICDGTSIQFNVRYLKSDGSSYGYTFGSNPSIYLGYDDAVGKSFIAKKSDGTDALYFNSNTEWTHITVIFETSVNAAGAYDYAMHYYANGVYGGTATGSSEAKTDCYEGTTVLYSNINEVRINFSQNTQQDIAGAVIAVDNVGLRVFEKGYKNMDNLDEIIASGESLSSWGYALYDEDAMPFGTPIAKAGGTQYDSVADAVAAAGVGGSVTLLGSTVEDVVVDNVVSITTGDYTLGSVTSTDVNLGITTADGVIEVIKLNDGTYAFKYVASGVEYYVKVADGKTLQDVFTAADTGSTITFLSDYTDGKATTNNVDYNVVVVNKDMTFDLNGYTFTIRDESNQARVNVGSATLNVKNGTLVAGFTNDQYTRAYPFFIVGGSGVLNCTNVDTYVSTLAFYWGTGGTPTVTVDGGEHHVIFGAYGGDGGFINAKANMNATVSNAKIYIDPSRSGAWIGLMSSVHYNCTEPVSSSSYIFNNCDIVSTQVDESLILNTNNYTTIEFNGCNIYGSIAPTFNSAEATSTRNPNPATGLGTVYLSEDTTIISASSDTSLFTFPYGYHLGEEASERDLEFLLASGYLNDDSFAISDTATKKTYAFSLKVVLESGYVIKWYDHNGSLVHEQIANAGDALTPPASGYSNVTNGWYKKSYDKWSLTEGGEITDDFTVSGNRSYYLVPTVSAYLTDARWNLKLMGHVQVNLYLPKSIPAGITLTGVTQNTATGSPANETTSVTLSGVDYNGYVMGYVGAASLESKKVVVVSFTAEIDGETYNLSQTITATPLKYCQLVLADSEASSSRYGAKAHRVAASMIGYSYYLCTATGKTFNTDAKALYDSYYDNLVGALDTSTDTSDFPVPDSEIAEELAPYVNSVSFEVSTYQPRFVVTFKEGVKVTDMKIEILGWKANSGEEGEPNWGITTHAKRGSSEILYFDENNQLVKGASNADGKVYDYTFTAVSGATAGTATKYIGLCYSDNIPIYNISGDTRIILTVEDENGNSSTVKGSYTLNNYYNGVKDDVDSTTLTNYRNFLRALRVYGEKVAEYRFGNRYPNIDLDTETITYEDFGVVGDGVTNDFAAIKRVHEYANELGLTVKGTEGATYYISSTDGTAIPITSSVDWTGVNFVFDDTVIGTHTYELSGTTPCDGTCNGGCAQKNVNIFEVKSDYSVINSSSNLPSSILTTTTNVPEFAFGYDAMVVVYNSNVKHFIRYGSNADSGQDQHELILVDKDGNIDSTTPVLHDFNAVTSIKVYRVDDTPVTITGGSFVTKANESASYYNYFNRGICVTRSNTTVTGFTHTIEGEGDTGSPYNGFVLVNNCHNVTVKDSNLQAHKAYQSAADTDTNVMGTYDISLNGANKVILDNVQQNNFYLEDGSLSIDGDVSAGTRYWGIMGTNFCKNLEVHNSTISRFDAHCGVLNATITNSTLAHITLTGGGTFTLTDSTVECGSSRNYLLSLRSDYGSTWHGDFVLTNVTVNYTKSFSGGLINAETPEFYIMNAQWTEHNFGYKCYMPTNVTVNGFNWSPTYSSSWNEKDPVLYLVTGNVTSTSGIETNATNPYALTETFTVTGFDNGSYNKNV